MAQPDLPSSGSNHKNSFIIGSFFTLLIVVVSMSIFLYSKNASAPVVTEPKEIVAEEVSSVEPTESKVNRSEIIFEVLNGAGVRGAAADSQDELQNNGYIVASIGNADRNDYESSQLYLSEELSLYESDLIADLAKLFQSIEFAGLLEAGDGINARIVIGRGDVSN